MSLSRLKCHLNVINDKKWENAPDRMRTEQLSRSLAADEDRHDECV
jgi:hypothetical protein